MADRLRRLDERPADVVIADQPEPHRQPRFFGIADRGAHARVGNGDHHVGVDAGFARQQPPEVGAHLVDALAEHFAVGPREVDVLEHAVRQRRRRERADRFQAVRPDDDHLAGLDVAHVGRVDQIERAGLRAHDPRVAEPAERERPESVRIARGDQMILRHDANENAPDSCAIDSTIASSKLPACDRA